MAESSRSSAPCFKLRSVRRKSWLVAMSWCVGLHVAVAASTVRAQAVPACTESPSDQEVGARLQWIERRLAAGTPYAASWWAGWLTFATAEGIWGWVKFAHTSDR
ncbi:MAG: hypothetical protein JWN04_3764, partial [Myxococcaceae bacterium]|nr:hypothetical protein [Myxococcaceae bacterium]